VAPRALAQYADRLDLAMRGLDGTGTYTAIRDLTRDMRVDAVNATHDPEKTAPEDAPAWVHDAVEKIANWDDERDLYA
jgi:hypothetical protein